MTIEAGQAIPQATFQIKTDDGVDAHESTEYFASGRTILFALPGAFTSTCSAKHLPEFVSYQESNHQCLHQLLDHMLTLQFHCLQVLLR